MPKLLHKLPNYRRHSTRDSAFVVIAGQRIYLPGRFGSEESKAEYRRLCAEWIVQDRPSTPRPPMGQLTIVELMIRFWRHCDQNIGRIRRMFRWGASEELVPCAEPAPAKS
jgi:hypothetical protein